MKIYFRCSSIHTYLLLSSWNSNFNNF
jgi:hypothetical protein